MTTPAPGGGAAAPSLTGSQTTRPPAEAPDVMKQEAVPETPEGKGLTADEEKLLGELLARRDTAAGPAPLRLRVEGEHESMTFGGLTIGREYTDVPPSMQGDITEAAALAGVKITQES